jgi:hypothetical protein
MLIYWEQCKGEFDPDGALCDVQVIGATIADWERVLNLLRSHGTKLYFTVDDESRLLPFDVAEVFALREAFTPALVFDWGEIGFATHFHCEDMLEFHFWPKDVRSQAQLDQLFSFITEVGGCLHKAVIVYHEGWELNAFFRYDAEAGTIIHSPQSA